MKKNHALTLLLIFITLGNIVAQETVTLYGKVTDFNNQAVDSASVWLKNKINGIAVENKTSLFDNAYETLTDSNGNFSIEVEKGTYYCLYAIKESDYGKTKLEYWAWNLPIYHNLEINPQYDRMEIYGINASEPQTGPFETYQVYFRPMSLTKALNLPKETKNNIIDIAPKTITKKELSVQLNGIDAEVVSINKVDEYARGTTMYGYLIQILKPRYNKDQINANEMVEGHDKISITLHSKETNEMGKGEYFVKRIGN
ncbi:carboxypeptidase-like regulatory domain-containing protein [Flagellimonas sp.]|uniref:carboxypeptidase-like regulatory domain-containing protein n=1 Tax=Flagellimonas sp. TaxID=2058762 RepID=UPI003B5B1034